MIVPAKDLRPVFLGVRSQGRRPTCLAFATSAANERLAQIGEHLSVEYLYYHAVGRTLGSDPAIGTTMEAAAEALLHDGQPIESDWPYLDAVPLQWCPPRVAVAPYRGALEVGRLSFDEIVAELNAERPVVLGLIMTDAFYLPDAHGRIQAPSGDPVRGGHAVLAMGHGTDLADNYLLVRNSWGSDWGIGGHAWVRQDYVERQLHQTASFAKR